MNRDQAVGLKACPFCGATTANTECVCEPPIGSYETGCGTCQAYVWGESRELAEAAWNRRAVEVVEKRDLEGEPDELLLSLTDEPDPDDEPTLVSGTSATCGQCEDYRPGTCVSRDVPDDMRDRPRTGSTGACVAYRSRREFLLRTCPYPRRKP
jgi:hypothetical protein